MLVACKECGKEISSEASMHAVDRFFMVSAGALEKVVCRSSADKRTPVDMGRPKIHLTTVSEDVKTSIVTTLGWPGRTS